MAYDMKKTLLSIFLVFGVLLFSSCFEKSAAGGTSESVPVRRSASAETSEKAGGEEFSMKLYIDGKAVPVIWEENDSVNELMKLARDGLTVDMSMYGGFEQVGKLGSFISSADLQMTTRPGDIVLYSGNSIVVFYGSNSWSYTKLGRLDLSKEEIVDLLSEKDVVIELKME